MPGVRADLTAVLMVLKAQNVQVSMTFCHRWQSQVASGLASLQVTYLQQDVLAGLHHEPPVTLVSFWSSCGLVMS